METKEEKLIREFVEKEGYWDDDGFHKFSELKLNDDDKNVIVKNLLNGTRSSKKSKNYQIIKNRYQYIKDYRWKPKQNLGWEFLDFLEWWIGNLDKQGVHKCYYCGCTEEDYFKLYIKNNDAPKTECMKKGKINKSKKNSFNSYYLEIDQKDPYKGYNNDNCVFACHLCNNAKSDLIHSDDFKEFIAPSINNYIKELGKD